MLAVRLERNALRLVDSGNMDSALQPRAQPAEQCWYGMACVKGLFCQLQSSQGTKLDATYCKRIKA